MLASWTESPAWTAAGWTMIHFLWVGAIVALSVRFAGRLLLSRAPPQIRYAVSLAGLAAMVLTAALLFANQLNCASSAATRPKALGRAHGSAGLEMPEGIPTSAVLPPTPTGGKRLCAWVPEWTTPYACDTFSEALAEQAPWIWLVGTPLTLAGLGLGLAGTGRLRSRGVVPAHGWITDLCDQLRRTMRVTRRVSVFVSDRVVSPVLVGVIKPVILLPTALLTGWTSAQLELILLHELAHVRRWDALVNLGQRLIEALLFFHPMIWVISRWVRTEREECCDAVVIRFSQDPRGYAETLALLATTVADQPRMGAMEIAGHPVVRRIRRILQKEDRGLPRPGELAAGAALLLAIFALPGFAALVVDTVRTSALNEDRSAQARLAAEGVKSQDKQVRVRTPGRVLHFPADRSLGEVYARSTDLDEAGYHLAELGWTGWVFLGAAKGNVTVPEGNRVRLVVDKASAISELARLAALGPGDLEELSLNNWGGEPIATDGDILPHLTRFRGLDTLELNQILVTAEGISRLRALPRLRQLTIRCPQPNSRGVPQQQLDDVCLAQVAELSALQVLRLSGAEVSDVGVSQLVKLSQLRELDIWSPLLKGATMSRLRQLPSLAFLRLGGPALTESCLADLRAFTALRALDVREIELTEAGLSDVGHLQKLEGLVISAGGFSGSAFAALKPLQGLRELEIGPGKREVLRGDDAAAALKALKSMERLTLFNCPVSDVGLTHLAELTHLKSLLLMGGGNVESTVAEVHYTDAGLEALSRLARLETLSVNSPAITDQGLVHLQKLTALKKLHLSAREVSNTGLAALATLPALEVLSLRTPGVTLSGLNALNSLRRLRSLEAAPIRQDNAGLNLSELTGLEELGITLIHTVIGGELRVDSFRDEDIEGLKALTRLRSLRRMRGITNSGMKGLARFPALEWLDIGGPGVTDDGLVHLAGMKNLKHLRLWGTFTEAALVHLERLTSLRSVSLEPPGQLNSAALARLRTHSPDLKVLEGAMGGGG